MFSIRTLDIYNIDILIPSLQVPDSVSSYRQYSAYTHLLLASDFVQHAFQSFRFSLGSRALACLFQSRGSSRQASHWLSEYSILHQLVSVSLTSSKIYELTRRSSGEFTAGITNPSSCQPTSLVSSFMHLQTCRAPVKCKSKISQHHINSSGADIELGILRTFMPTCRNTMLPTVSLPISPPR